MPERKFLPKYKRAKEQVPLRIQPRDVKLINLVYQYRFLETDHLVSLLRANKYSIYRRLRKLYHNRYLDRLFFPIKFYSPVEPFVYALGTKGAELLAEELGIRYEELKWNIDQNKVQERYLRHALMVSNFHTILACAAREQDQLDLIFWKQGKELEDQVIFFEGERGYKQRVAVVPDAFFSLEDKRPGREGRMYFFLECNRSTMTTRRFLRKMQGYWHYWRQEKQERKFGIRDYRVLTLTKSYQRRDNLREVTRKADERQTGSYMFWFATEKDLTLDNPLTIFEQIWKTAVVDAQEWHSILE